MYALNIKFHPTFSKNGNVTMSKTVLGAINALVSTRKVFSASDIAYVINFNLASDDQVSEVQVERIIASIAADYAKGYRYNALRGILTAQGMGFYEYR